MSKSNTLNFGQIITLCIIAAIIAIPGQISDCSDRNQKKRLSEKKRELLKKEEAILYSQLINLKEDSLYITYLKKFVRGKHFKEVDELFWQSTILCSDYKRYIRVVPKGKYISAAKDSLDEKLWRKSIENSDFNSYVEYYNSNDKRSEAKYYFAAIDSVSSLENRKWGTDDSAWSEANKLNTLDSYKKYLMIYPEGKKAEEASKKIIDLEVDAIFDGDYGSLPSMDNVKKGNKGNTSNISVYNNTSYTLTLRYSGKESKILALRPGERSSITLENGIYRVAASASGSNVRNYAGAEALSGGEYNVEYYIKTTRY